MEEVLGFTQRIYPIVVVSRLRSTTFLGRCSFSGVRQSGTLRGSGGIDSSERDWFARPQSLSSTVSVFRKLSRLETALSHHDQLLGVCGSASRRERFRLLFRSKEEGYPLQIARGALLMEAERREDVALSVRLVESLARSVRSLWHLLERNRYALDYIKAVTEVEAKRPLHRKATRCVQVSLWR